MLPGGEGKQYYHTAWICRLKVLLSGGQLSHGTFGAANMEHLPMETCPFNVNSAAVEHFPHVDQFAWCCQ